MSAFCSLIANGNRALGYGTGTHFLVDCQRELCFLLTGSELSPQIIFPSRENAPVFIETDGADVTARVPLFESGAH